MPHARALSLPTVAVLLVCLLAIALFLRSIKQLDFGVAATVFVPLDSCLYTATAPEPKLIRSFEFHSAAFGSEVTDSDEKK